MLPKISLDFAVLKCIDAFSIDCDSEETSFDADIIHCYLSKTEDKEVFQKLALFFNFKHILDIPIESENQVIVLRQLYAFSFNLFQKDIEEQVKLIVTAFNLIKQNVNISEKLEFALAFLLSKLSQTFLSINILDEEEYLTILKIGIMLQNSSQLKQETRDLLKLFLSNVILSIPINREFNEDETNLVKDIMNSFSKMLLYPLNIDFDRVLDHLLDMIINSPLPNSTKTVIFSTIWSVVYFLMKGNISFKFDIYSFNPFLLRLMESDPEIDPSSFYPEFEKFEDTISISLGDKVIDYPTFPYTLNETLLDECYIIPSEYSFDISEEGILCISIYGTLIGFDVSYKTIKSIIDPKNPKTLIFVSFWLNYLIEKDCFNFSSKIVEDGFLEFLLKSALESRQKDVIDYAVYFNLYFFSENIESERIVLSLLKTTLNELYNLHCFPQLTSAICYCMEAAPDIYISVINENNISLNKLVKRLTILHCSNQSKLIEDCRKQTLIIIEKMLSIKDIFYNTISSQEFIAMFLRFVYEKPLIEWFNRYLYLCLANINYATETNTSTFLLLSNFISNGFQRLIVPISKAMKYNMQNLTLIFRKYSFYLSILKGLSKINDSSLNMCFMEMVTFLANNGIELNYISAYDSAKALFNNKVNREIYDSLWNIVFGLDFNEQSMYDDEIKNGGPLPLLFMLLDGENRINFLKRVNDCANKSVCSIFAIAQGGLPSYLIKCIEAYRTKERDELYDEASNLFLLISSCTISVKDMCSFFRCLAPLEDGKMPDISHVFINLFLYMFTKIDPPPESIIHINSQCVAPLIPECNLHFNDFTFLFDIEFLEMPEKDKCLFTIFVDKDQFVQIVFRNSNIHFIITSKNYQIDSHFNYRFAINTWTKIAIVHSNSSTALYVNGTEQERIKTCKINIEGPVLESHAFSLDCNVGVFGFYEKCLSNTEIALFSKIGRTSTTFKKEDNLKGSKRNLYECLVDKALVLYDPSFSIDNDLINIASNTIIKKYLHVNGHVFKNFIGPKTALKLVGGLKTFLPLFNQIEEDKIISLLGSLSELLKDMHKDFDNGFLVLSYLLEQNDCKYVSEPTIYKLDEMYQECPKNLKEDMLRNIYFNQSLWKDLNEQLMMMFVSFVKKVFIADKDWFASIFSFSWILFYIRVCLTTESTKEEDQNKMEKARNEYWNILLEMSNDKMTNEDLFNIFILSLDSSCPKIAAEALNTIRKMLKNGTPKVTNAIKNTVSFKEYYPLLQKQSTDPSYVFLQKEIIMFFCTVQECNSDISSTILAHLPVEKWVDTITMNISLISDANLSTELLMCGYNFILPIAFACLSTLSSRNCVALLNEFNLVIQDCALPPNYFIPLIIFIISRGKSIESTTCINVILGALKKSNVSLASIVGFIESLSVRCDKDFSQYIKAIIENSFNQCTIDDVYMKVVFDYLFFIPSSDTYFVPNFNECIDFSDEEETDYEEEKAEENNYQTLYSSLVKDPPIVQYTYGMRHNGNEWLDEGIALRFLEKTYDRLTNENIWMFCFVLSISLRSAFTNSFNKFIKIALDRDINKRNFQTILTPVLCGLTYLSDEKYDNYVESYQKIIISVYSINDPNELKYTVRKAFSDKESKLRNSKICNTTKLFICDEYNENETLAKYKEQLDKLLVNATLELKNKKHYGHKCHKEMMNILSSVNGPWWHDHVIHYKLGKQMVKLQRAPMIVNNHFDPYEDAVHEAYVNPDAESLNEETVHMKPVEKVVYVPINDTAVVYKLKADLLTQTTTYPGEVFLTENKVIFDTENLTKHVEIDLNKVSMVLQRKKSLEMTAIEIFTDYTSYFIDVKGNELQKNFLKKINRLVSPKCFVQVNKNDINSLIQKRTEEWLSRKITNYDYLMYLNIYSGRSFNDTNQYPIFPVVLSDYTSKELNLNDESVYRDLSKPLGALKEGYQEMFDEQEDSLGFRYLQFYSNGASVCGFLLRTEPFTKVHIDFQSGFFDHYGRLFTSIPAYWDSILKFSTDFREMIPEFYTVPDFLANKNKFFFGYPDGNGDVELPPWAKSPEEFILKHRMALESPYVTEHLNEWIDLIFGVYSRGKKAKEKKNNFSPYFFEECLDDPETDRFEAQGYTSFGEAPFMIFHEPHKKCIPEKRSNAFKVEYITNAIPRLIAINSNENLTDKKISIKTDKVIGACSDKYFAYAEIWDSSFNINCRIVHRTHSMAVTSMAIDKNYLVTGSADGTVFCTKILSNDECAPSIVVGRHACISGFPIVTTVCVSVDYNIVASFSHSFMVLSTPAGDIGHFTNLDPNMLPIHSCVTSTGYVVVCCIPNISMSQVTIASAYSRYQDLAGVESVLYIFDLNCNLLCKKCMRESIISMCAFGNVHPHICYINSIGKPVVLSIPFIERVWRGDRISICFDLCTSDDDEGCKLAAKDGSIYSLTNII